MRRAAITGCLAIALPYLAFVNHLDPGDAGISRNIITGNMWLQQPGFHLTAPWTLVTLVDTRLMRVCITSASHATFNCRLVQFNPNEWRQFVAVEGWRYYWLSNRFSLNLGYPEEYRGFRDILRGYAFNARPYPFVIVRRDYDTP